MISPENNRTKTVAEKMAYSVKIINAGAAGVMAIGMRWLNLPSNISPAIPSSAAADRFTASIERPPTDGRDKAANMPNGSVNAMNIRIQRGPRAIQTKSKVMTIGEAGYSSIVV